MSHKDKARWKVILNIVTFVALVVLIWVIRDQIIQSLKTIGHIRWGWLLLMPILQALNYDAYARQNRELLKILGRDISYKFLYHVNLELNFVNHVFPSGGVSGFSYFSMRLKEQGVSGTKASLVQLMRFVLVYVSFLGLLILALIMLSFSGQVNGMVLLVGGSLSTLIVIGTMGLAYIIGSQKRINAFFGMLTKFVNRAIHVVRKNHPETIGTERAKHVFEDLHDNYSVISNNYKVLKMPLVWSFMANLTEVLTLYVVYLAFGHAVNPGAVILAYAIANFAGFLSILPSGIGVYEALMTTVLAIGGIPAAISIPVTIMYRVVSMAIQLVPGYWFYYHRMSGGAVEPVNE